MPLGRGRERKRGRVATRGSIAWLVRKKQAFLVTLVHLEKEFEMRIIGIGVAGFLLSTTYVAADDFALRIEPTRAEDPIVSFIIEDPDPEGVKSGYGFSAGTGDDQYEWTTPDGGDLTSDGTQKFSPGPERCRTC